MDPFTPFEDAVAASAAPPPSQASAGSSTRSALGNLDNVDPSDLRGAASSSAESPQLSAKDLYDGLKLHEGEVVADWGRSPLLRMMEEGRGGRFAMSPNGPLDTLYHLRAELLSSRPRAIAGHLAWRPTASVLRDLLATPGGPSRGIGPMRLGSRDLPGMSAEAAAIAVGRAVFESPSGPLRSRSSTRSRATVAGASPAPARRRTTPSMR